MLRMYKIVAENGTVLFASTNLTKTCNWVRDYCGELPQEYIRESNYYPQVTMPQLNEFGQIEYAEPEIPY